jgi:hypothetical protein
MGGGRAGRGSVCVRDQTRTGAEPVDLAGMEALVLNSWNARFGLRPESGERETPAV